MLILTTLTNLFKLRPECPAKMRPSPYFLVFIRTILRFNLKLDRRVGNFKLLQFRFDFGLDTVVVLRNHYVHSRQIFLAIERPQTYMMHIAHIIKFFNRGFNLFHAQPIWSFSRIKSRTCLRFLQDSIIKKIAIPIDIIEFWELGFYWILPP